MDKDSIPEKINELIDLLSRGLSIKCGEEFFPTMTKHLARLLNADYTLIAELAPGDRDHIKTLSFAVDGELVENISYPLKDTPCQQVLEERTYIFEQGLQQLFPKDKALVDMQAEGYAGVSLKSAFGEPLGIVCALYRHRIPNPKQTEQLLRIFAGRAGSELERRRDQATLHQQEQGFRQFYERSPLSYQSLDAEGRFIAVNPAWIDTFGYSREDILGRKFSDIMTEESQSLVSERFPRLKESGELREAAFEVLHKDGHVLMVILHGRASYDAQGVFLHTNCILIDVSETRRSEDLLRQSEESNRMLSRQFQTLLDGIPDRIMLLDPALRIVWTNQKTDIQQKPFTKKLKGLFCYEAIHNTNSPCPNCPAYDCLTTGKETFFERTNPDNRIWMQRAFPIFDDQGQVANVVEIGQDITDTVMLRKETVRTGQLAALGELAAGVAHEINNPITGVINCAQLLINRSSPESQQIDLAERIIKEGERVARIVSQLLFHARDEGNELVLLNLTDPLSDSLAMVGSQFNKDGINIDIELAENLPKIKGHAQQLQQVFLNILSNARYALNKRFPQTDRDKKIKVALDCNKTEAGANLVLCIYDHGIGIPSDLLTKVLQPFVTSKSSVDGTGLGLSICNDIMNNHGASLQIDSAEGVYTEVTIIFPVPQT